MFLNLATSEAPAVLPEVELAKLALITSKDEEAVESESHTGATGTSTGSADTESTLVESQIGPQLPPGVTVNSPGSPATPPPPSRRPTLPVSPTASVLGKRSGDDIESDRRSPMDVDATSAPLDTAVLNSSPKFAPQHHTEGDADVKMEDSRDGSLPPLIAEPIGPKPPPLPPRRRTEVITDMMFGKRI